MNTKRIQAEILKDFVIRVLNCVAVRSSDAAVVADVLVEADMRGISSHGVSRLGRYVRAVKTGEIDVGATMLFLSERGSTSVLDAANGFGQVAGVMAMDKAIATANEHGIGMVFVRNSSHFGIAGYYAERALPNSIGIAMSNTSPLVVPTNGKQAVLGTNPIAVAAPTRGDAWLMDFSTSAVSRGKIEVCQREGKPLDPTWALDEDGRPCTDAQHVLDLLSARKAGGIAPMADYKGYGLSFMVDLLSGVLSGSAFGLDVHEHAHANVGHCFLAINIEFLMSLDVYLERMNGFCEMMRQSAAEGNHVFLHGEKESAARRQSISDGVLIKPETETILRALADEFGLEMV